MKLLRHLHIELFILPYCHKVDLAAAGFADIDGIASAAKLQVHDILKAGCHAVSVVAKDAVPQGGVRKIEFLLCFQDFLTLQIKAGASVKQIGFFQLLQVAVNRFVIQRTMLRFQIIRNGFCREGVAHIAEGVLDHSFQLINLPHLIVLDNMKN